MSNWTAELTRREPSDQDILDYVESTVAEREEVPSLVEEMQVKMAQAYQAGINLARAHGEQVFDNVLEKNAKIFGDEYSDTIDNPSIPYENRKAEFERHLKAKSEEKPSGYLRGIGGGILWGGGLGGLMGMAGGPSGAGAGALIGGGLGGLAGAAMAKADKMNISEARKHLREGTVEKALMEEIENRGYHTHLNDERRHQELLHAMRGREKRAEAEKVAILPAALAVGGAVARKGAGSALGGMAKQMGKDMLVDGATNMASNALSRARQPAQQAAPAAGGFKYARAGGAAAGLVQGVTDHAKKFTSSIGAKSPGTFGQKIVGGMIRNPGAALIGAGMVGGAVMAPRDPVTGEKQYLKGALRGGVVGGGAYALGGGNALRKAVVNPKGPQIFGEQAGAYAREAAKVTAPKAGQRGAQAVKTLAQDLAPASGGGQAAMSELASSLGNHPAPAQAPQGLPAPTPASFHVPVQPPQVAGPREAMGPSVQVDPKLMREHDALARRQAQIRNVGTGGGGSVQTRGLLGGQVQTQVPGNHTVSGEMKAKFANRQTLTYDPATKRFTRTHLTADTTMGTGAGDVIPAGHREAVTGHQAEPVPRGPAPAGLRPSPGASQTYASSLGVKNVVTSAPRENFQALPPPIPVAGKPRSPIAVGAGSPLTSKSPIAAGAGAAVKAAPKAPALPSLAGARSLVRR